jgi:hypothetical protein
MPGIIMPVIFEEKHNQQQQHNLLSQASWGRLEMKPKRDEKQGDTQMDINGTRQKEKHNHGEYKNKGKLIRIGIYLYFIS